MKKKISVKTLVIIVLIGIIGVLVLNNVNNKNIKKQKGNIEQLGETTTDNAYVKMQTHLSEVNEKEQKLLSFKTTIATAITEMGEETSENADADTMASNIRNIEKGYTIPRYTMMTPGAETHLYGALTLDVKGYNTVTFGSVQLSSNATLFDINIAGKTYTSIGSIPKTYDVSNLETFSIVPNLKVSNSNSYLQILNITVK